MESDIEPRRGRRKHSPELKAEVIQACCQPGVSIRSVALARGLSPSLVRRWLGSRVGNTGADSKVGLSARHGSTGSASDFVAVRVENRQPAAAAIHLDIRRGGTVVTLDWPVQEAVSCGAWLKEWLR
ncbi:MAG TPA: transposase [Candidatus Limnocylindrales bacterium]|nr:transposase [Candidatus Limnocylindrales bacterium]